MKSLEKRIRFTETVLRDGQQSQIATRMTTAEMTPVLQTLDKQGIMLWKFGAARPLIPACAF